MDPDAAWLTLNDETIPVSERIEAGRNLFRWLGAGGFPPVALVRFTNNRAEVMLAVRRQIEHWEAHR